VDNIKSGYLINRMTIAVWNDQALNMDKWWSVVNAIMKLRVI